MKPTYVSDLEADQPVTSFFLVWEKEIRQTRDGKPFLRLELGDRTGTIEARMWENFEQVASTFERDDFVKVQGRIEIFRNRPQLALDRLRKAEPAEVEPGDYFPHTPEDIEQLYQRLCQFVAGVGNAWLRRLLSSIVEDPELVPGLKRAPAAKMMHHAYLGGLLEHVVSLCGLCRVVAAHYPEVDTDLLLAGAVLHDVGKMDELSYARSFSYTIEGELLGHIVIELGLVRKKIEAIEGFPRELAIVVEHLLVSHHGHHEFGSPRLPMFREAVLLHFLDDLDSKMEAMRAHFEREAEVEGPWTSYNASLGRPLLDSRKFMQGEKAQAAPSADDSGARPATPAEPEHPTSAAPAPDVFSEQKA